MADVAGRVIATEAKRVLAPLGVVRKGRSRSWVDDHGWWLINIEFQPSSYAKGCFLNVGEQHLWVDRDYLCFEDAEQPLGSKFIAFEGDEHAFTTAMRPVVDAAVAVVLRRRAEHGEGLHALQRIAARKDDLNAGIASALLGEKDEARSRLTGRVHDVFRECASRYLGLDQERAQERAWAVIQETRSALGLPSTDRPAWNA